MALDFLQSIDLNGSEIQNAVAHKLATASFPTGEAGQFAYDTTTNVLKYHNGTQWNVISTGGSHVDSVAAANASIVVGGTATDPTIAHGDTSTVGTLTASSRTYVDGVTFDTYGHVTAISTSSESTSTDYINAGTFNSSSGDLALTGVGSASATVNLDGRYLTSEADGFKTIAVAGQSNVVADSATDTLTLVGAGGTSITTAAGSDTITITSANTNDIDYISGATFSGGTLALTGVGNAGASISLDGRYLTSFTESDTLDSVTGRGASTSNGITVGGLVVNGDLTVTGSHTVTLAEEVHVEDSIFVLNHGTTGTPSEDAGLVIERGTSTNVGMIWDESADQFAFVSTNEVGNTTGNVTIADYADFRVGAAKIDDTLNLGSVVNAGADVDKFLVQDASGNVDFRTGAEVLSDIGAAPAAGGAYVEDFTVSNGTTSSTIGDGDTVTIQGTGLISVAESSGTFTVSTTANNYALPDATSTVTGGAEMATTTEASAGTLGSNYAVTPAGVKKFNDDRQATALIGNGTDTTLTVTHGLGSKKVIVEVVRVSDYKTMMVEVARPSTNTVAITFHAAPASNAYEVFIKRID